MSSPIDTVADLFAWLNSRIQIRLPVTPPADAPDWLAALWGMPVLWVPGSPTVPEVVEIEVADWPIPAGPGQFTLLDPKIEISSSPEDTFVPASRP